VLLADIDDLEDVVVSMKRCRSDVDVDVVGQEILGKSADLFRPGGRPHEALTIRPDLLDDFADLGLKTHVKHSER